MEISKELLEKVLGRNIVGFTVNVGFIFIQEKTISHNLNTYEFAFKCKEWANTQDYWTQSGYEINHLGSYFCMIKDMPDNQFFYADTEIEAIIKSCEWILDNEKNPK